MRLFQIKQWWKYRQQAKGRHGVHSPFVYELIDEGLTPRMPRQVKKALRAVIRSSHDYGELSTIYRLLHYMQVQRMEWKGVDEAAQVIDALCRTAELTQCRRYDGNLTEQYPQCVLIGGPVEEREAVFKQRAELLEQDCFFIIPDIHDSPMLALFWQWACEQATINLSLDLWHIGVVFFALTLKSGSILC